jgi:hypothetical protein
LYKGLILRLEEEFESKRGDFRRLKKEFNKLRRLRG